MSITSTTETSEVSFYGLGIAPQLLDALKRLKFSTPTPIQLKAIPIAVEGQDLIGIAQTGTGKTLAFGIPLIQRLAQVKGRGLVLLPTRELAMQVHEHLRRVDSRLRSVLIIGGASMHQQTQELRRHPRLIIATPGRLVDHLQQRNTSLQDVKILVLDEADRMLDMGFAPQIKVILRAIPRNRQTMLFSATMPPEIVTLATSQMRLPVHVEIAKSGTGAENVTHEIFIVKREAKKTLLGKVLKQYHGSILIFTRTKHGAKNITRYIRGVKHTAAEIHSNRSLGQRREALEGFRSGKYRILVATDIASRGLDITGIELVINYDLPDESENYVHRIGRTGRAGDTGHAISFAMPDQGTHIRDVERVMRIALPISEHPEMPLERFSHAQPMSRPVARGVSSWRRHRPRWRRR